MPYYIKDKKQGEEIIRSNVCAVCGRRLYIYIEPEGRKLYVGCGGGHSAIAKEYHPSRMAEQGLDALTIKARSEEMTENYGEETTKQLVASGIPLSGLITKEQATEILTTVWKGAPEIEVYKAAMLCQDFGLHPLMNHIYLIKYDRYSKTGERKKIGEDWITVLGIGATRLLMSRQGTFSYIDDTPRIMSEEEQIRIFGKVDTNHIVAITKLETKDGLKANGYGKYPKTGGYLMGEDKGNSRENMAFIRSERSAFGRLFPDAKMPSPDIEVVDEKYVPKGAVAVEEGKIVEVEGRVLAPEEASLYAEEEAEEETLDETQVTKEEAQAVTSALEEAGIGIKDFGQWCNTAPNNWGVEKITLLKKWQHDAALEWISGVLHGGPAKAD